MKRRSLLKAAFAAPLATPALAQPVPTLRFIPQANLTALDPVWTTATVTFNHAYYVFDVPRVCAFLGARPCADFERCVR